uniref:Uncharacterized protein n=1 Tax=Anguilla anguilla TaxID=7936 RepID=A0A0E9SYD1_ANGAN
MKALCFVSICFSFKAEADCRLLFVLLLDSACSKGGDVQCFYKNLLFQLSHCVMISKCFADIFVYTLFQTITNIVISVLSIQGFFIRERTVVT